MMRGSRKRIDLAMANNKYEKRLNTLSFKFEASKVSNHKIGCKKLRIITNR